MPIATDLNPHSQGQYAPHSASLPLSLLELPSPTPDSLAHPQLEQAKSKAGNSYRLPLMCNCDDSQRRGAKALRSILTGIALPSRSLD